MRDCVRFEGPIGLGDFTNLSLVNSDIASAIGGQVWGSDLAEVTNGTAFGVPSTQTGQPSYSSSLSQTLSNAITTAEQWSSTNSTILVVAVAAIAILAVVGKKRR